MKKILTVLIAAGALLGAAGCSPAPKLSNADTCSRVKTVVSSPTATSDKAGMSRLANQLRPIEAVASDDLKAPLKAIIDFFDESAKDSPDTAKIEGLKASYSAAGQTYSTACAAGQ